jgi:hypothetical protein
VWEEAGAGAEAGVEVLRVGAIWQLRAAPSLQQVVGVWVGVSCACAWWLQGLHTTLEELQLH